MPIRIRKVRGKYRLVEPGGRISKSKHGKAKDGGGHSSKKKAAIQASIINRARRKK